MAQQHYPSCGETERLWPSDSLYSRTERWWQSATEESVPPGFNFTPTEGQLILDYLIPYALGWPIRWDHVVEEQVYEKEPWELLGPHRDNRYLFTTRTMQGSRVKRAVGAGTWSVTKGGNSIQLADGKAIGLKTKLSYYVSDNSSGYTMDEYKVSPDLINNCMPQVRTCFFLFISFTQFRSPILLSSFISEH